MTEPQRQMIGTVTSSAASITRSADTDESPIDPATAQAIGVEVARIAGHFRPDLRPQQAEMLTRDFIEDLARYRIPEIQAAFAEYRRAPDSRGFPRPGAIIALIQKSQADRRTSSIQEGLQPEFGESRPSMWWAQPKSMWRSHWRESDVPSGEKIRDEPRGVLRDPAR